MSKGQEEIHEFHAARKLNILKGFKEVSDVPPVPLKELQERVGKENVYTYEVLKGFIENVLEKGSESERLSAKEQINNLQSIVVVDERGLRQVVYVEKGHMDFGQSGGGRQGLVKKQITDTTGKRTTRWVRANKDEDGQEKQPATEDENPDGSKPISEHAKETSSEDLKKYLAENPDGEHATHAKRELQVRGELEGGDDTAGEGDESGAPELDYSDANAVKEALANHPDKEAIVNSSIENGITIGQAMKLNDANKTDHSETHAAIDQAQASLDALKEKTGHSDVSGDAEAKVKKMPIDTIFNGYKKVAEGKWQKVSTAHKMTKKEHKDFAEKEYSRGSILKRSGSGASDTAFSNGDYHRKHANDLDDKEYDDAHVSGIELQGKVGHPDSDNQDDIDEFRQDEYDEGYDDSIMSDMEDAIGEEFGIGAEEGKSLHVNDIKTILENYDVMSNDPQSQTGIMDTSTDEKMQDSIKRIAAVMERNGWAIEGA